MLSASIYVTAAIFITCVASETQLTEPNSTVNPAFDFRDGRFFGLFDTVINNNRGCRALNGDIGTCLSYPECFAFRGTVSGACGRGLGFCCVTNKTCQGTIWANNTYFVNPNYPASYTSPGQCYVTINRLAPNVCQLRLDFEIFSISQPEEVEHRCVTDSFVVSGTSSTVPVICGDNAGQHMYLNIGYNNTRPIMITVITSNLLQTPPSRNWKIRVSQIPCNEGFAAPPGCLQYYTGVAGTVMSYNFFFETRSRTVARQLSYQDYTICMRQESGFCEMRYSACPDQVNVPGLGFSLSGSLIAGEQGVASATDANCVRDYLLVPCGSDTSGSPTNADNSACVVRMCGSVLNAGNARTGTGNVFTRSTPFELRYYTNGVEAGEGDQGNLGFCLNYQQQACPLTGNNLFNNFNI